MKRLVFDMETADPDDILTLCILATHPKVHLLAVTVTPGSREQVGVVRHVLGRIGRGDVVVGAFDPLRENPKHVSEFHRKWLGSIAAANPDGAGPDILADIFRRHPDGTLLTGAPLKNPGAMLVSHPEVRIATWVAQGGFAGDSVVPPEHRLPKFAGRETCPTFNFNGAVDQAKALLATDRIGARWLVSKNVCHGVVYDQTWQDRVGALTRRTRGFDLVHEAMGVYLAGRPEGKAFHDPLAAAVAIDPTVCDFREVEVYRERGEWGSRLAEGTRTRISVAVHRDQFFDVLTAG